MLIKDLQGSLVTPFLFLPCTFPFLNLPHLLKNYPYSGIHWVSLTTIWELKPKSKMHFPELKDFILNRMRMSHIYQPLMLMTLLKEGGVGSIETISKELLTEDKSQQEYYGNITKNMVGRVLKNHGIVQKNGESFKLIDYETYTADQRIELIQICQEKLNEYIEKRGKRIFEHRRKSAGILWQHHQKHGRKSSQESWNRSKEWGIF